MATECLLVLSAVRGQLCILKKGIWHVTLILDDTYWSLWSFEPHMFRSPILRLARAYSKQISEQLSETWKPLGMSTTVIPDGGPTPGFNKELRGNGRPAKKRKIQEKPIKEGSSEEILLVDIKNLLAAQTLEDPEGPTPVANLPEPFTEIDLTITELSSTGDGLAIIPSSFHVCVVPFAVPGDRVVAKVIRHVKKEKYSVADFVKVLEPSPLRDDSRIKCSYFATCGGCQFQMLDYDTQLAYKKQIVEKAFKNFSGLNPELVPPIGDTIGSPLQYGYRTKLTPHFDGPPGWKRQKVFESVPPIGFMKKGMRKTIDIEDCPIGTDSVREGMKRERVRVTENIKSYKKGATLLLRESTKRIPKSQLSTAPTWKESNGDSHAITKDCGDYMEEKICITSSTKTSVEYVDDFIFENPAGQYLSSFSLPSVTYLEPKGNKAQY
jgi:tRNA (uracil-5-)-methyltransferase